MFPTDRLPGADMKFRSQDPRGQTGTHITSLYRYICICVYLYSERHNLTIIISNLAQQFLSAIDWTSSLTKRNKSNNSWGLHPFGPQVKVLARSCKEQPTFMENKLSFSVPTLNMFIGVFDFQIT